MKIMFSFTSINFIIIFFKGTFERQEHLREGKYFECDCDRCSDPTELGTHLSSILCTKCKTGYVNPMDTNYLKRYTSKLNWKCANCEKLYCGNLVRTTMDEAKNQFENIGENFSENQRNRFTN